MTVSFQPNTHQATKNGHNAESRSTSAGSRDSGNHNQPTSGYAVSLLNSKLPEYEYPVHVVVRNTFIEAPVGRPLSLDEFYEERRIHSCPVSPPECDDQDCCGESPEPQPLHRAIATGAHAFMTMIATTAGFWTEAQHGAAPPVESFDTSRPTPRLLMLAEALPEPELGSHELPTVGSAGHYAGTCKPCAFFYTKGCENGTLCPFCHLCPPTEKRRRQKEKLVTFREMRRQRRQMAL